MSLNMEKAVKTLAVCGAAAFAVNTAALVENVQANAPKSFIGPDGHAGKELSFTQSALMGGAVISGTLALGAAAFGAWLKKDREKEQQQAAILAAKQNVR